MPTCQRPVGSTALAPVAVPFAIRSFTRFERTSRIASHGEKVLFELGQLPGADQRRAVHQVGNVRFSVAMVADVQVEHELRESAMEPRQLSREHHEPRS